MKRDKGDVAKRIRTKMRGPKPSPNGTAPRPAEPEPPPPSPRVETFTAADLMAMELPEPKWAVEGVLPEGLSIFAGKPKLGKSWMNLNVALAVASGGTALGSIGVEAGDVLYLALEDTRRRLQNRLTKLLGAQQTEPPARLTLATVWPRADQGGLDAIAAWLDSHKGARLIIIDTWARFRRSRVVRANEYEIDYADAAEVKALADQHGVACTATHHCRKMGAVDPLEEVSGTMGLTGAADAILVLRRERGQHDATLHVTGRDVEEQELALKWSAEYALWSILGAAEDYRLTQEQQRVIDELRKHGAAMKPVEMAAALEWTRERVKLLMWRMGQAGLLVTAKGGRYALPETADTADTDDSEGADDDEIETPWN